MNPASIAPKVQNLILNSLSDAERSELLTHASLVALPRGRVLHRPEETVHRIYFIERGMLSLVKEMNDGRVIEIGAQSKEGVTTPEVLIDSDKAIFTGEVQVPISAWVVDRRLVLSLMEKCPTLKSLVHGYFHISIGQVGQTAACNRLHSLEERCCRWLLTAHDGAGADTFPLTHEFLAMMIGAPRAGVTIASNLLRRAGYIDYTRGRVTIVNRRGLEQASCECYGTMRNAIKQLFHKPVR